jgi:hypothetical protein
MMFYASPLCPVCKGGAVGFRKCSDGKTIVLTCDECNAVWFSVDKITEEAATYPSSPDFHIEALNCSIASAFGSRWAVLEEIKAAQLDRFIAGEDDALNE